MSGNKKSKTTKKKAKGNDQREVPTLRKVAKGEVAAILLSDIHLQDKPPMLRCKEPDWYDAMARPLVEIKKLVNFYGRPPVLCAGDIFDHWKAIPELINFAIEFLPQMYAIPGQHDLPYHNLDLINASAYRTLMHAGIITNVDFEAEGPLAIGKARLVLHGFPYGVWIQPLPEMDDDWLHVAIAHEYTWLEGYGFPNAPKENKLGKTKKQRTKAGSKKYGMYDVVLTGDNHRGFQTSIGDATLFNAGALMHRHKNELEYRPQVGLLLKSGKVIPAYLDTSKNIYLSTQQEVAADLFDMDIDNFFANLEKLDEVGLDYRLAIEAYLKTHKVKKKVKDILLKAIINSE